MSAQQSPRTIKKKDVSLSNLLLGASLNMFEVTSLGQPLEVIKTTMAAHRNDSFPSAMRRVWARGGFAGFYQGLIPWAWLEASTKGAVLLFVASSAEYRFKSLGASDILSGMAGGMTGGVAQAYATVGFCTAMKTAEITRSKIAASGVKPPSTMEMFRNIWQKEGIRGINKGVNAVAIRQVTNWGSRFGLSRVAEDVIRKGTGKDKDRSQPLGAWEKILASSIGGGLSAWNQPIEVIRVELQSMKKDPSRPGDLTIAKAARYIYQENGIRGLYRGATPRIGLGVWQTVCMVALGDMAKDAVERVTGGRAEGH
ncbi:mitochondrial carrier domain-containing protein [Aspergillus karnatakaensis]|uniref:mitochondrial carrier domain-containing protein n=1 Tax=Aspergillus karnatakaensis TaxID=1810916 RepID=UPI003CCCBA3C